jgi:antitoxin FitA
MSQILVRDLDRKIVDRLKSRAEKNGRSLEGEVRLILEQAACFSHAEARNALQRWQKVFAGRKMADSGKLIREDRRR